MDKLLTIWTVVAVCYCYLAAAQPPNNDENKVPLANDDGHYHGAEHDANYDHQQFLGEEGAEMHKKLTPEEAKEHLGKIIPTLDLDQNGQINEYELKEHIIKMQRQHTRLTLDHAWQSFQKDNKLDPQGLLSWDNFREVVYGKKEDVKEDMGPYIERDSRRWSVADRDHDDKLNKEEYGCFMRIESIHNCEHMTDIVLQEGMDNMDRNKDGLVDINEYLNVLRESYPHLKGREKEWEPIERNMFFVHRDIDKDKMLDRNELKPWIIPSNIATAEQEAKHLIQMSDDNKDMVLSTDEMMKHYEVFVGYNNIQREEL